MKGTSKSVGLLLATAAAALLMTGCSSICGDCCEEATTKCGSSDCCKGSSSCKGADKNSCKSKKNACKTDDCCN